MSHQQYIARVINLIPDSAQRLWSMDAADARQKLLDADSGAVLEIDGSFALVAQDGERVLTLASSQVLADAIEGGSGKFEPLVLPHGYSHLAPLAGVA